MIRSMGHGMCPCGAWATHLEWMTFEPSDSLDRSNAALAAVGAPPVGGVWSAVCGDCCDPAATHKEARDGQHGS